MKQALSSRNSLVMGLGIVALLLFSAHLYRLITTELIPRLTDHHRHACARSFPRVQIHIDRSVPAAPRINRHNLLIERSARNASIWSKKNGCLRNHVYQLQSSNSFQFRPSEGRSIQIEVDRLEGELHMEARSLHDLEHVLGRTGSNNFVPDIGHFPNTHIEVAPPAPAKTP